MDRGSQRPIVLPIFASSDREPGIYRNVADLEADAEPVDVRNGEWSGCDASGREITFVVEGDRVTIGAGSALEPERLAEWLRSSAFLKRRKSADWLRRASLPELAAAFDAEESAWRSKLPLARLARALRVIRRGRGRR